MEWGAIWLTIRLATATTLILGIAGIPLAYWLAMTRWRGRFFLETLVALPLVLPPTVLGYYLLVLLGPRGFVGGISEAIFGARLPFSFAGILIGSILFNLPFAIRPFVAAFRAMDRRLVEASWCLGETQIATFFRVTLPICWPGILAGLVLTFAHSVGEFGVVLMIGGNRPLVTRTLSISIYDQVQEMRMETAGQTALLLLIFSFLVLSLTQWIGRREVGV